MPRTFNKKSDSPRGGDKRDFSGGFKKSGFKPGGFKGGFKDREDGFSGRGGKSEEGSENGEKRSFGKSFGSRTEGRDEKKPFVKKSYGSERASFGKRESYGSERFNSSERSSERPSFGKREYKSAQKPYSKYDKYNDESEDSGYQKKTYLKNRGEDKFEKRGFSKNKPEFSKSRSDDKRSDSGYRGFGADKSAASRPVYSPLKRNSDKKTEYKPSGNGYNKNYEDENQINYFVEKSEMESSYSSYDIDNDYADDTGNKKQNKSVESQERVKLGNLGEYKLIDCGDGQKLEAFGSILIVRPCPQALWPKNRLNKKEGKTPAESKLVEETKRLWKDATFEFVRMGQERGFWWNKTAEELEQRKEDFAVTRNSYTSELPQSWQVTSGGLVWQVEPNQFGNIGIFSEHFEYASSLTNFFGKGTKVLNLFTYSGSNCLVLAREGLHITAVDSSKSAMTTFNENLQNNSIDKAGHRLILEDAYKFVARETRREATYDGIMIDAPSYGRGTKGEVFNIEDGLKELIETSKKLMSQNSKMIITLHSPRFTPKMLEIFIESLFEGYKVEVTEIIQKCQSQNLLTSGMLVKIFR